MTGTGWLIQGNQAEHKRKMMLKELSEKPVGEFGFFVRLELGKRTDQQRKALEVYCSMLAKALNDAGLPIKEEFLGKSIELDWTQDLVKERLWRGTQLKLFNIKSTTQLNRAQVSEVYETINRFTADNFGIHVAFPERDRG